MQKALQRFFKYFAVGFSTFLFDLLLLYVFTDVFGIHYLVAAGISYLISVSANYVASRRLVFAKTDRSPQGGYLYFIAFGGTGLALTVWLMALLTNALDIHYLIVRIAVAGFVGIVNYLLNLYVNFNVAGRH